LIPIAKPIIEKEEIEAVSEVLKSGIIAQGPKVKEFESKFSDFIGAEFGIATNSGTAALHVALLAHDIGPGDEVVTTPFSFIATVNCIRYVGAKPVFVDIKDDFNIDCEEIQKKITPKTKAIIAVHLYGLPCDMNEMNEIANEHDLILIEDCAQAHGAEFKKKKVGSFGTGCFSFYPTKNMTTSEGGIITTDDEEVAEKASIIRNHGMKKRYYHEVLGFNLRMTDIEAAIGIEQLKKLPEFNKKRITNANYLTQKLDKINGIATPKCPSDKKHVYHQYTIRVKDRNRVALELNKRGVGTGIYYPLLIPEQSGFILEDSFPFAEKAKEEVLSLPIHPSVSKDELDYITDCLGDILA